MTALTVFAYDTTEVRVVEVDGQPWFVAADVAMLLGFRMASDLTRSLAPDERGTRLMRTPSGDQDMVVISEPGLWRALIQRQTGRMTDQAMAERVRDIQRWVTRDVLPTIRRTGTYTAPGAPIDVSHIDRRALALMVVEAEDARHAAEARIAELEPMAAMTESLLTTSGDYSVRETAQILTRDHGVTIGQNRLFAHLRLIGWIDRRGIPYQAQIDAGRVAVRVRTYTHPHTDEPTLAAPQVRITPRGLLALHTSLTGPRVLATTAAAP